MDLRELPVSRAHPARALLVQRDGATLELAPTTMADAEEIADAIAASLPELRRFMPWAHVPQTALGQLERLRTVEADHWAGRELTFGLFRARAGGRRELLTMVGLHPRVPLNPLGLEVGYWAPTPHAGQGWTTFAVRCALVYAFDKLGATRVQVSCDEANSGSRRVIEKCGFACEGVLRNILTPATPEQRAAGYATTGRNPLFALFPDTFAALPWVSDLRALIKYINLAGHLLPAG